MQTTVIPTQNTLQAPPVLRLILGIFLWCQNKTARGTYFQNNEQFVILQLFLLSATRKINYIYHCPIAQRYLSYFILSTLLNA